jgi:hypothetical protein
VDGGLHVLKTWKSAQHACCDACALTYSPSPTSDSEICCLVPEGKSKKEFTTVIHSLPDIDTPALFGLPPNIEVYHPSVPRGVSATMHFASVSVHFCVRVALLFCGYAMRVRQRRFVMLSSAWIFAESGATGQQRQNRRAAENNGDSRRGRSGLGSRAHCLAASAPACPLADYHQRQLCPQSCKPRGKHRLSIGTGRLAASCSQALPV